MVTGAGEGKGRKQLVYSVVSVLWEILNCLSIFKSINFYLWEQEKSFSLQYSH